MPRPQLSGGTADTHKGKQATDKSKKDAKTGLEIKISGFEQRIRDTLRKSAQS